MGVAVTLQLHKIFVGIPEVNSFIASGPHGDHLVKLFWRELTNFAGQTMVSESVQDSDGELTISSYHSYPRFPRRMFFRASRAPYFRYLKISFIHQSPSPLKNKLLYLAVSEQERRDGRNRHRLFSSIADNGVQPRRRCRRTRTIDRENTMCEPAV